MNMNKDQITYELEKISNSGINLLNSARDNGAKIKEKFSDNNQHYLHGFAWYATYFKAIESTYYWIKDLAEKNLLTNYEVEIAKVGIGEFCLQIIHGIPMSQSETIRPNEILIDEKLIQEFHETSKEFINGSLSSSKQHLCDLIRNNSNNGISPNFGLDDTYFNCVHKETNIKLGGGIDDIFLNTETGQVHIVDYKSTAQGTRSPETYVKKPVLD